MAYTSFPLYLDPSPNWNQHQQQQQGFAGNPSIAAGDIGNLQQQHAPPRGDGGASVAGAVRSNSMTERARLAKIPQPEHALKCPRCDSTNTKFCYFNNYSLTQPRHFCKTCRRYWTRGGSLRNVPVGGGCRRNKRSKSSRSKPSVTDAKGSNSGGDNGATSTALAAPSQLPFLQSLHSLVGYGSTNIGMNYCGIPSVVDPVDYPAASSSGIMLEPWRLHQIHQLPFFAGIEANSIYPINGESTGNTGAITDFTGHSQSKTQPHMLTTQLPLIKMELSSQTQGLNLERHHMGIPSSNQYWHGDAVAGSVMEGGGAGWTDLSGFSSASTGVLL